MPKFIYNYIHLFFLAFLSISCHEIYDAPLDTIQKEILVIEGRMTNLNEDCKIRITKAIGFNENEYTYDTNKNIVSDATVSITDNLGHEVFLLLTYDGYYQADASQLNVVVGRSYSLTVKTSDGNIYTSKPEVMLPPAANVEIEVEDTQKKFMKTAYDGSVYYENHKVKDIFINVDGSKNLNSFFKIETRIVSEVLQLEWRKGRIGLVNPTYVFYWNVGTLEDKPIVKFCLEKDGLNVIKHLNLAFIELPISINDGGDKIKDPPINIGWLLTSHVLSISENEYNFYLKLNEQLSAKNKIFDPLPTQLYSNMKCTTDASKIILGYFGINAKFIKDVFVGNTRLDSKIPNLPDKIENGKSEDIEPFFWWD